MGRRLGFWQRNLRDLILDRGASRVGAIVESATKHMTKPAWWVVRDATSVARQGTFTGIVLPLLPMYLTYLLSLQSECS